MFPLYHILDIFYPIRLYSIICDDLILLLFFFIVKYHSKFSISSRFHSLHSIFYARTMENVWNRNINCVWIEIIVYVWKNAIKACGVENRWTNQWNVENQLKLKSLIRSIALATFTIASRHRYLIRLIMVSCQPNNIS